MSQIGSLLATHGNACDTNVSLPFVTSLPIASRSGTRNVYTTSRCAGMLVSAIGRASNVGSAPVYAATAALKRTSSSCDTCSVSANSLMAATGSLPSMNTTSESKNSAGSSMPLALTVKPTTSRYRAAVMPPRTLGMRANTFTLPSSSCTGCSRYGCRNTVWKQRGFSYTVAASRRLTNTCCTASWNAYADAYVALRTLASSPSTSYCMLSGGPELAARSTNAYMSSSCSTASSVAVLSAADTSGMASRHALASSYCAYALRGMSA
mmetsp:Transcript_40457/g.99345  ORF Transcript_40457/g.99345 Transcript_40457/m.99345 type:complete len:266 (+) Transcript_40457:232-1029(+)